MSRSHIEVLRFCFCYEPDSSAEDSAFPLAGPSSSARAAAGPAHDLCATVQPASGEEQIDLLYDELARLRQDQRLNPHDTALKARLHSALARLRELQEAEADRFLTRFAQSLSAPLDAGAKLLDHAKALLAKHENPPPIHGTPAHPDSPQAQPPNGER